MAKENIKEELKRLKSGNAVPEGGNQRTRGHSPRIDTDHAVALILEDMRVRQDKITQIEAKLISMQKESTTAEEVGRVSRLQDVTKREAYLLVKEKLLLEKEERFRAQLDRGGAERAPAIVPKLLKELEDLKDMETEIREVSPDSQEPDSAMDRMMEHLGYPAGAQAERSTRIRDLSKADEVPEARARTGLKRLDDLLYGGLPIGCNVLINGTKHTGKEILARHLVVEGLMEDIPVVWVITDTDPLSIRREMTGILPHYGDYEKRGLVKYVDLYSLDLGIAIPDPNVRFISMSQPDFFEQLGQAVEVVVQEFLKKAKYYRLIFQSVSTLTASVDSKTTIRFLMPFVGRRLREGAVSYYLVDTGMHTESDIDLLEHVMEGSIEMKVENTKTLLAVKGIVDKIQSRAWISYTYTKNKLELGSFSLGHIR